MQLLQRSTGLRPAWLATRRDHVLRRGRLHQRACAPRAQRGQPESPSDRDSQLALVVRGLEALSVTLAVGAHVNALVAQRGAALRPSLIARREAPAEPYVAEVPAGGLAPSRPTTPGLSLWLTLPLLAAYLFHKLHEALTSRRRAPAQRVSDQAAARLLRLESAAQQQQQGLDVMGKQLEKLHARVRLASRDLSTPLKQVQEAAAQQAEVLVSLSGRVQQVERDVRDNQDLLTAMQGVSAKQFDLLLKVIKQQEEQARQQLQILREQREAQEREGAMAEKVAAAADKATAAAAKAAAAAVVQAPAPPLPPQQPIVAHRPSGGAGEGVDEWGRRVAPLPPSRTAAASAAASAAPAGAPAAVPREPAELEFPAYEEPPISAALHGWDSSDASDLAVLGGSVSSGSAPSMPAPAPGPSVSSKLIRAVSTNGGWSAAGADPAPPAAARPAAGAGDGAPAGESTQEQAQATGPAGLSKAISEILNHDPFFVTEQQMYSALTRRQQLPPLGAEGGDEQQEGGPGHGPSGGYGFGGGGGGPHGPAPGGAPLGGSGLEYDAGYSDADYDVVEALLRQLRAVEGSGGLGGASLFEGGGEHLGREGGLGGAPGEGEEWGREEGGSSRAEAGLEGLAEEWGREEGPEGLLPPAAPAAGGVEHALPGGGRVVVRHGVGEAEWRPRVAEGLNSSVPWVPPPGEAPVVQLGGRRVVHHRRGDHAMIEEEDAGTVVFSYDAGEAPAPAGGDAAP